MKKIVILLVSVIFLLSSELFAQLRPAQSQYFQEKGALVNPSFEQGYKGWEITGTCTQSLVSDIPYLNKTLKLTCVNQSFSVKQNTTELTGFVDQQALLTAQVKASVSGAFIRTLNNDVESSSVSIIAGDYKAINIPDKIASTSNGVEIHTNGVNVTGEFFIDEVGYRLAPDLIQQVGQAQFVGDVYVGSTNCTWSGTSTTFASFAADSDCNYIVSGNLAEPDTKIPAIKIPNARTDGYYKVTFGGTFNTGVAAGTNCDFTLSSDGTNQNKMQVRSDSDDSRFSQILTDSFRFDSTGDKQVELIYQRQSGTVSCFTQGSDDLPLKMIVHFFPDSNSTIVSQDTELNHIIYSQQSAQSVPDGIQVVNFFNSDIIKNSQFTIDEANDRIYPNKKGYYLVNVLGGWASNTAIKGLTVLVNDTNPTNGQCREQRDGTTSSGTYHGFVCNLLELNKSDYITILARQESGGNLNLNDLNIQIIEQSIDAKVIGKFEQIEEVTADLTFETVNELSAQVLSDGNTFTQNYNWIDSCSRTSTGIYVCNLVSNFPATQEMACVATTTPNVRITKAEHRQTDTPQTLRVTITDEAGNLSNQAFNVICSKQGTDVNKSFTGAVINASQSAQTIADIVREDIVSTDLCQVEANNNTGQSLTANVTNVPFINETKDNCNAYDGTTYTAQKNGLLLGVGVIQLNAQISTNFDVYKNGTKLKTVGSNVSQSNHPFSFIIDVIQGDLITIRPNVSSTLLASSTNHVLSITELPDTASIVQNLAANQAIKCQTKYLQSDISGNQVLTDLTFSGLTASKRYCVDAKISFDVSGSNRLVIDLKNGATVLDTYFDNHNRTNTAQEASPMFNNVCFLSDGSDVTFTSRLMIANTIRDTEQGGTWARVCELNDFYTETTEW